MCDLHPNTNPFAILDFSSQFLSGLRSSICALTHTKDGIPSGCVATESEDVGVVSSDHS